MKVIKFGDIIILSSERNNYEIHNWKNSKALGVSRCRVIRKPNNPSDWEKDRTFHLFEDEIKFMDYMLCPASPSRIKWEYSYIKEYREVLSTLDKIKYLI